MVLFTVVAFVLALAVITLVARTRYRKGLLAVAPVLLLTGVVLFTQEHGPLWLLLFQLLAIYAVGAGSTSLIKRHPRAREPPPHA